MNRFNLRSRKLALVAAKAVYSVAWRTCRLRAAAPQKKKKKQRERGRTWGTFSCFSGRLHVASASLPRAFKVAPRTSAKPSLLSGRTVVKLTFCTAVGEPACIHSVRTICRWSSLPLKTSPRTDNSRVIAANSQLRTLSMSTPPS